MYSEFLKNLEAFKKYEVEASKRIELKFNVSILSFNNTNKYDFITSDNITYEVKTEPLSLKTNNFFIEFKGYGKPSGISTTEANYYIFSDTINYYLISTNILKQLIKETKGLKIVTTSDKLTYGYLINKNIIIDASLII